MSWLKLAQDEDDLFLPLERDDIPEGEEELFRCPSCGEEIEEVNVLYHAYELVGELDSDGNIVGYHGGEQPFLDKIECPECSENIGESIGNY
jgi:DNA-directed RNA polymerase subunit RPC12/RpoP